MPLSLVSTQVPLIFLVRIQRSSRSLQSFTHVTSQGVGSMCMRLIEYLSNLHSLLLAQSSVQKWGGLFQETTVLALFSGLVHSSLAVQNLLRRSGPFYHVIVPQTYVYIRPSVLYQRVGRFSIHVGMAPMRNICNT